MAAGEAGDGAAGAGRRPKAATTLATRSSSASLAVRLRPSSEVEAAWAATAMPRTIHTTLSSCVMKATVT